MANSNAERAQLVSQLWKLKKLASERGLESLNYIHFNLVLNDPGYRADLIEQAKASNDAELVSLAWSVSRMDEGGPILHRGDEPNVEPAPQIDGLPRVEPVAAAPTAGGTAAAASAAVPPPVPVIDQAVRTRNAATDSAKTDGARWIGSAAVLALFIIAGALGAFFGGDTIKSWLGGGAQRVSGSINEDTLWKGGETYRLDGIVYVEAGARLTIEPGVTIVGSPRSALVVTRDASILARGSRKEPIVFTSGKPAGERAPGDWGGLVLLGNAPVNRHNPHIEGLEDQDTRGYFGGNSADSSCGVLEYVRIEFAGFEVYANNELNGLTLGGCGSTTIIRHLQVHRALDDGIEVFGGTVDLKNLVVSGANDDSFDWDMGWRGRVQFLVIQQFLGIGDNGFEGDNWKKDPNIQPRSAPTFFNVTMIGAGAGADGGQRAMTIRRGSGGTFRNFIISGFPGESIDIRDAATAALLGTGELSFGNMIVHNIGPDQKTFFSVEDGDKDDDGGLDEQAWFSDPARAIRFGTDPLLKGSFTSAGAPDFVPAVASPAAIDAAPLPQAEFWDESANYLGAIRPGVSRSWVDGWTSFPVD